MFDPTKDLQARIERTKKLLDRLEETLKHAENHDFVFRVTIKSAWHDYGEQNGVGEGSNFEEALHNAEEHFKKVNSRVNVEASAKFVTVNFPNGFTLTPHEFL